MTFLDIKWLAAMDIVDGRAAGPYKYKTMGTKVLMPYKALNLKRSETWKQATSVNPGVEDSSDDSVKFEELKVDAEEEEERAATHEANCYIFHALRTMLNFNLGVGVR